jgi:hypothetical protein
LDPLRLPPPGPDRTEIVRILEREAALLPAAYYVDCSEVEMDNRADVAAANELVDGLGAFTLVASREPWRCERRPVTVHVPAVTAAAQLGLWRAALGRGAVEGIATTLLERITQHFDLGPAAVEEAVATARGMARMRDLDDTRVAADDLWSACRAQAAQPMEGLAQRLDPCFDWDDLVLPADAAGQLRELAAQVVHRAHVYERWGFGTKLGRGRGISALFAGPSGTGKTMAAEVLARHVELDLYRIDLSNVVSKYIGETERRLRRVFDVAEQAGAILFFDEADALFGKRTEVKDSHDRFANIEINYLLQRMEDYRGLAILATNKKDLLDDAFLRRLRFLVDFPFPDAEQRRAIWEGIFPPETDTEALDFGFLARLEIAGGNIKTIALNAAFLAAAEDTPVRMPHILRAARREYLKINKLIQESEFGSYYPAVRR